MKGYFPFPNPNLLQTEILHLTSIAFVLRNAQKDSLLHVKAKSKGVQKKNLGLLLDTLCLKVGISEIPK